MKPPRRDSACRAPGHSVHARRRLGCICPPTEVDRARNAANQRRYRTGPPQVRTLHSDDIDHIAVERLVAGQSPKTVTRAERLAAIEALTGRGVSGVDIARQLSVSLRTVYRYQAQIGVPA